MIENALGWMSSNRNFRKKMRFIPPVHPVRYRRRYRPPSRPWAAWTAPVPDGLRGQAGIGRDADAEQKAFEVAPLPSYNHLYPAAIKRVYRHLWHSVLPTSPRYMRGVAAAERTQARARRRSAISRDAVPSRGAVTDTARLTADVQAQAGRIGLSAIGIARYDEKYTFAPNLGKELGDRVIVCVLEQHHESTQLVPGPVAERAALITYAECMKRAARLATYLQGLGYRAESYGSEGTGVIIHYAVQAGLGQLGFNGQLLTPVAGSRCRLIAISTDAPLDCGQPRDYGIDRICDECQICVRRCPGLAIPRRRMEYRGVQKAKINTKRCLPLVGQASGCGVCMKVCPVQRYGLEAVYDEYEASGRILGKDTAELEGFTFPVDGRFYGPGDMPKLPSEFFFPLS
ncbi:MAG TPA: reductive dehalogenase domain-containing protein [Acidimicrobiales bacterium]|jgi:Pyruvate/2-oxoacid:ferredoxin oxidoreductase delta subunit|nr:reductive dehalogenase domain-containing protein [Acidimicrobiales bacterium]